MKRELSEIRKKLAEKFKISLGKERDYFVSL